MIKQTFAILAFAISSVAQAFGFDDITFWAGSGSKRAALVIDWNDDKAPPALAWGYRFDGEATGEDMLRAIVTSDPLAFAKVASFSFGTAVVGLGYDPLGDGLPLSDGTTWPPDRWLVGAPSDGAVALDFRDRYVEGWLTEYWSYWLSEGASIGSWTAAQTGISDRILTDGSWDGLSFAPAFVAAPPDEPLAAPEPGSLVGSLLLAWGLMRTRVRRTPERSPTAVCRAANESSGPRPHGTRCR